MGVYNSRLFRVSMKCYAWCVEGGGFRVVLSRAIRTLIKVIRLYVDITIVTLLISLLTKSHDPPSTLNPKL